MATCCGVYSNQLDIEICYQQDPQLQRATIENRLYVLFGSYNIDFKIMNVVVNNDRNYLYFIRDLKNKLDKVVNLRLI